MKSPSILKSTVLAAGLALLAWATTPAWANPAPNASANADCEAKATEKKLAGAAKTSFIKKCIKDSGGDIAAMCEKSAADKKLAGAAKTSHIKKCTADASK